MAIDTENRRRSVLNFILGGRWQLLPVADDVIDGADRQMLLGYYSGIAWGAPVAGVPGPYDVQAVQVFLPGMIAGDVHEAGRRTAQVLVPGAIAGEVDN